jgi:hypothetical protein
MTEGPEEPRSNPVDYDVDDLVALSKLVPRGPIQVLRIAGGVVVILLVVTITAEAWALTGFIDWSALVVGLFLGALIILFSDRRIRARLWLKLTRRSPLYAPQSFEVAPAGLRISSPKLSSEIRWSALRDMKQAEDRLFFFVTKRLAYIVPRRAFDSDSDFEAFAAAAADRWEQRHQS